MSAGAGCTGQLTFWNGRQRQRLREGRRQRVALTLECGLQNATLAIVVASSLLGDIDYAMPAAIYGLMMFATAGLFILWARRWSKAALRARNMAL